MGESKFFKRAPSAIISFAKLEIGVSIVDFFTLPYIGVDNDEKTLVQIYYRTGNQSPIKKLAYNVLVYCPYNGECFNDDIKDIVSGSRFCSTLGLSIGTAINTDRYEEVVLAYPSYFAENTVPKYYGVSIHQIAHNHLKKLSVTAISSTNSAITIRTTVGPTALLNTITYAYIASNFGNYQRFVK